MATITYLPPPIKVENNRTDSKPDYLLWGGCTIALGILSFYAPKTFFATSVGIYVYQVYRFNQLVQTADNSKHQQIHKWAINACIVMWSVGTVFGIKSLPCFWFALKELRHLHLIPTIGHLAKGVILGVLAGSLASFNDSAKDLASRRRWVEMEDYVTNYPVEVKQNILSSYGKQLIFYISALLPQTGFASFSSARLFESSQFQPENSKFFILNSYFERIAKRLDKSEWPLAIHQFQQLPVSSQLTLGRQLSVPSLGFSDAERNAFPEDIKAVILSSILDAYIKIPTYQDVTHGQWLAFVADFEKLPRERQSILGYKILRLAHTVSIEALPHIFPETMRLAALKVCIQHDQPEDLTNAIFDGLSDPFKNEFGVFLKGLIVSGTLEFKALPQQMKEVVPHID